MDPTQIVPLLVQFAAAPLAIIVVVNWLKATGTSSASSPWVATLVGVSSAYLAFVLGISGESSALAAIARGLVQSGEAIVFYDLGKGLRGMLFPPPAPNP